MIYLNLLKVPDKYAHLFYLLHAQLAGIYCFAHCQCLTSYVEDRSSRFDPRSANRLPNFPPGLHKLRLRMYYAIFYMERHIWPPNADRSKIFNPLQVVQTEKDSLIDPASCSICIKTLTWASNCAWPTPVSPSRGRSINV